MRKLIRTMIGLMACAVLVYSLYEMYVFYTEETASSQLNERLVQNVVTTRLAVNEPEREMDDPEGVTDSEPQVGEPELPPITVDFDKLRQQSENIIGWLYCEDTPINLPVAQSRDNSYYLRRLLDGTDNNAGTLFADYRNAGDFSDRNTIIYGHNMKNKTMFGSISEYRDQVYFDEHPVMWLLTEETDFKVELIAGYLTKSTSDAYANPVADEDVLELMRGAMKQSTFESDLTLHPDDNFVTLSTCSYEFEDARYVLVGRLVPVE